MTVDDVQQIIQEFIGVREVDLDSGMGSVRGWDSLRHVALILELQDRLGLEVSPDMLGELTTVRALVSEMQTQGLLE